MFRSLLLNSYDTLVLKLIRNTSTAFYEYLKTTTIYFSPQMAQTVKCESKPEQVKWNRVSQITQTAHSWSATRCLQVWHFTSSFINPFFALFLASRSSRFLAFSSSFNFRFWSRASIRLRLRFSFSSSSLFFSF